MAKKKDFVCRDYADAENLMVKMDGLDRKIGTSTAALDSLMDEVDKAKATIKSMASKRGAIEKAMAKFAETRKGLDFTGEGESRRKKALKKGVIGFRMSPAAVKTLSRDWTEAKCIEAMKELRRSDPAWKRHAKAQLIRVKETLNKNAIADLGFDAGELARAGLQMSQDDVFWARTAYQAETEEAERQKKEKEEAA